MIRNSIKKNAFSLLLMLVSSPFFAQATNITSKITGWTTTIKTVLNGAVAAFAVVGGFLIFIQYMQGKQEAQQNFVKFVIGLAIFGIADLIVNVFI